jgi:excisionase family DNA binding protein
MRNETNPPNEDDYVDSLSEVAARWNVSVDTIRRAVRRGDLQLTKLGPRRVGLRRSEGRRYLNNHTN